MYFCVSCATPIVEGLLCQFCPARSPGQSTFQVLHCNFCAAPMKRTGTECGRCETVRLARLMPSTGKKSLRKRVEMPGQQSLW
jgi:hypothetical protein